MIEFGLGREKKSENHLYKSNYFLPTILLNLSSNTAKVQVLSQENENFEIAKENLTFYFTAQKANQQKNVGYNNLKYYLQVLSRTVLKFENRSFLVSFISNFADSERQAKHTKCKDFDSI